MSEASLKPQEKGLYRNNVGVILLNSSKKIFVGRRFGTNFGKSSWQMPQGGIIDDETEEGAISREIYEEIGLVSNSYNIIKKSARYHYYTIPQRMRKTVWQNLYIGQKQRWFLAEFKGKDEDVNINVPFPEFEEWSWKSPDEIMQTVIPFKKDVYKSIFEEFNLQ